ncbi:MAG TPA: helix-turn-helix domain-containing protein [Vicinamibacterales bacterium]|nr:helix-turn-helix domain-containing protein [Vicinamibacterales bacterium]
MSDLGSRLKHARESRAVSLQDIAARTKISPVALEALERGDVSKLPGGIFGRAFVKAYAIEVGLDPDNTVAEFAALITQAEADAAARGAIRPEVTADDRAFLARQQRAIRTLRIVLAIVAIGAVAALFWQLRTLWARSATVSSAVTTPPAMPTVTPPASAAPGSADPPAASAAPAATPPAASPSAPLVVEFEVTGDCWIQITTDGKPTTSQLFRAGERRRLEAQREVSLDVGNAGTFLWTINGRPAKALGNPGVHARTRVTAANYQTFLQ